MRHFVADILALHFGRADKWWAWFAAFALIVSVLVWRLGIDAVSQPPVWKSLLFFGVVSGVGVVVRRWGKKDD